MWTVAIVSALKLPHVCTSEVILIQRPSWSASEWQCVRKRVVCAWCSDSLNGVTSLVQRMGQCLHMLARCVNSLFKGNKEVFSLSHRLEALTPSTILDRVSLSPAIDPKTTSFHGNGTSVCNYSAGNDSWHESQSSLFLMWISFCLIWHPFIWIFHQILTALTSHTDFLVWDSCRQPPETSFFMCAVVSTKFLLLLCRILCTCSFFFSLHEDEV